MSFSITIYFWSLQSLSMFRARGTFITMKVDSANRNINRQWLFTFCFLFFWSGNQTIVLLLLRMELLFMYNIKACVYCFRRLKQSKIIELFKVLKNFALHYFDMRRNFYFLIHLASEFFIVLYSPWNSQNDYAFISHTCIHCRH